MRARPLAVAFALAAFTAAASGRGAAHAAAGESRFSRAEWVELVRLYARGERAQAIAGLAARSERDLVREVTAIEQAARTAARCPRCPGPLDEVPLRAAVMLHWDLDRGEQPSPLPGENEQPRRCPGPAAVLAARLARVMARDAETSDFARRFLRMVVLQSQWDACFTDAELWASEAIVSFPRDAALLLARGSLREEGAALGLALVGTAAFVPAGKDGAATVASATRATLQRARQDLADAVAVDPGLTLARVRLARVLWRLGEPEAARRELESVLTSECPVDHAYLARLFLGRLHQDAGRLVEARREYALAADLHPTALSAATALSDALLLAGDAEGAREALRHGLAGAGHRSERDPLWEYLTLDAAELGALKDALHRESLQ